MNFQSNTMLIIFGAILAISVISLVVLLILRNKKMKSEGQKNDLMNMAGNQNNGMPNMNQMNPMGQAAGVGAGGAMATPDPMSNAMQFTSNPFEPSNIDLNSQNLGTNLEATAGVPNEGIMQNPTSSPAMQTASAVAETSVNDLSQPTQPVMATPDPMTSNFSTPAALTTNTNTFQTTEPAAIPSMNPATNTVANDIPAMNPNPINTTTENTFSMPQTETPAQTPSIEMPASAANTTNTLPGSTPTPSSSASMNVNSVNSSGLDANAQPVNPLQTNAMDPAGVFTQTEVNNASNAPATPQPTSQMMNQNELDVAAASAVESAQTEANTTQTAGNTNLDTNTVADLTPEQDLKTTTSTESTFTLPEISAIDTNTSQPPATEVPKAEEDEKIISDLASTASTTPAANNTTESPAELPPLPTNIVNSPVAQTVPTETASPMSAPANNTFNAAPVSNWNNAPAAPTPTMSTSTANIATPIQQPTNTLPGLGIAPDPALNNNPMQSNNVAGALPPLNSPSL